MSDTEEAAPAAEDTIVLDEPIVECIAALSARSSDREATGAAIKTLATKVGELAENDQWRVLNKLNRTVRENGGACDRLVALLADDDPDMLRPALLVIGNLASDNCDPAAVIGGGRLQARQDGHRLRSRTPCHCTKIGGAKALGS